MTSLIPNTYLLAILVSSMGALLLSLKNAPLKGFKHIASWIRKKLVYTVRVYQYDELFYILEAYLFKNYQQQYRDVEASLEFGSPIEYPTGPKQQDEKRRIHYKQEDNVFIIQYRGKRIMITKEKQKIEKGQSSIKELYFRQYQLKGWRCKAEINDFLEVIFQEHERARPKEQIRIYTSNSYGEWQRFDDTKVKPLENVFLPDGIREELDADLQQFVTSEAFYEKVGIPYKRGYCFYGPPGNGKTSLSLAMAAHLGKDIYILNVSALSDDSRLQAAFSDLRKNSVLLIEDSDKIFIQRENKQDKVSFSAFLNVLDGALSKHGLIVIMTTNHIDHLDPALLRDGRVDMKLHIPNPDENRISNYVSLFYDQPTSFLPGTIKEMCMASVQEICIRNKNDRGKAVAEIIL